MTHMPREVADRMREFFDAEAKSVQAIEERNLAAHGAGLAIKNSPLKPGLYVIDSWFFHLVREKVDTIHPRCQLGEYGRVEAIE